MTIRRDRPGDSARDGERRPTETRISARLEPKGRGPEIVAVLIAIFVALALVKPWGSGPGAPRPTAHVTVAPVAAPSIDPLAALRHHCEEPVGWRVYTSERWAKITVRSWKTMDPADRAIGPLDPAIPIIPLAAQIDALGYCSPWTGSERPPAAAIVSGWMYTSDRGPDVQPSAVPIDLQLADPGWPSVLGALYGPPVDRFDPNAIETIGWPSGRYVFAIQAPGFERWWGVDIEPPPRSAQSADAPTPGVAPAGGPAESPPPVNP